MTAAAAPARAIPRYRLIVDIFEPAAGGEKLVLTHVFYGDTEQEAHHYYQAHTQSDAYLRACVSTGLFRGSVPCRSAMRWEVAP